MNIEYCKWHSPALGQQMELKIYGFFGKPLLVFPAQGGRFYEFEDFGMIAAITPFIEAGQIKVFTLDSIDSQSWANLNAPPADRARRHEDYDRYITQEVAPFIIRHCGGGAVKIITTGVSMGAYHAANFFFRHPDLFDSVIALSGLYRLNHFIGDYTDETVYINTPLAYLGKIEDPNRLELYRQSRIIICCGQGAWEEESVEDARALESLLQVKGVLAEIDLWGQDVNHDWPWWRKMLPHHLGRLKLPGWKG
jgi:esterase/lipase superfamily enzyme